MRPFKWFYNWLIGGEVNYTALPVKTINIANDFSKHPTGCSWTSGPYNGQAFRMNFLVPSLREGPVCVELDGTTGFSSSFLEEAFGGLVTVNGFSRHDLVKLLLISATDRSLITEAWGYINNTQFISMQPCPTCNGDSGNTVGYCVDCDDTGEKR